MNVSIQTLTAACFFLLTMILIYPDSESVAAEVPPANYDESKIPCVVLPEPLLTKDGRKVDSAKLWNDVRRPELLDLFTKEMFGVRQLPASAVLTMRVDKLAESDPNALGGKATRHQLRLRFFNVSAKNDQPNDNDPKVDVLIYTPNNVKKKVPAFLGLNFRGNHTVSTDPGIVLGTVWAKPEGSKNFVPTPAKEEDRGVQSSRWPLEMILDKGFAVVTAYYGDIEPDFDGGIKFGVRKLVYSDDESPKPDEAGAIATWAWGLSLIREVVVEKNSDSLNIDPTRIAVHGHSRLGKTALWAGATDPKFALTISNDSGCGGAALSRREFGETVFRINTSFPHWFCGNFKKYNQDVNSLPFDQHELIALIAPRPVYVASAEEDRWADPKGEFLSAFHADPVYRLLGTDGINGVTRMPEVEQSVGGTIGYHLRTGKHDVTEFDWECFLNFAAKHFR